MPMARGYTDEQLQTAVANASTWSDVMEAIGKRRNQNSRHVKEVVWRLGLDTSHFGYGPSLMPHMADDLHSVGQRD